MYNMSHIADINVGYYQDEFINVGPHDDTQFDRVENTDTVKNLYNLAVNSQITARLQPIFNELYEAAGNHSAYLDYLHTLLRQVKDEVEIIEVVMSSRIHLPSKHSVDFLFDIKKYTQS